MTAVLSVKGLGRVYRSRGQERVALADVSFSVAAGKTLAVIGESGAGKSTLSRLLVGLERPTQGSVLVNGTPPRPRPGKPSAAQLVFQSPIEAVSPYLTIGATVAEPMKATPRRLRRGRVEELLEAVGLDKSYWSRRPRTMSGGQLQRVVLARALAAEPSILVCDEPTSALDVSVQAQIVNLLLRMQSEYGWGCVWVTHDLAVARVVANDVVVLRHGRVLEHAPNDQFFGATRDAYSRSLLAAAK